MHTATKVIITLLLLIVTIAGIYLILDYLAYFKPDQFTKQNFLPTPDTQQASVTSPSNTPSRVEIKREIVAENLHVPWSIVWTSADRLLFTERNGSIKAIVRDQLQTQPLITFPEVTPGGEQGLMGLAVDPNYAENRFLYVARAEKVGNNYNVDIIRLIDEVQTIRRDRIIIEDVPAGSNHAGTRLKFGPDQKLYVSTGDALERSLAQDRNSKAGKILRYNPDSSIPADNPTPNSPVWSLGHRNPQGLAWDNRSGNLWQTEHGPSGFDGPGGGDEINLIVKGENYGWPIVSHERSQAGLISPKLVFTPAVAPASLEFYNSDTIPQFKHNLFFGALRGESLVRIVLNDQDPTKIDRYEKFELANNLGRIREVAQGPNGAIYFSTSNKDGRGNARSSDDKIYRISIAE